MKLIGLVWTATAVASTVGGLAPTVSVGQTQTEPTPFIYASRLEAPRGLRFGPDGDLYVAEAGTGGTNSTSPALCKQVPGPVGPYTGGMNGRISKISSSGKRTTVAAGFPSTQDAGGDLIGVSDIAFLNGTLYAAVAGGGCSHGNPESPSGIALVDRANGSWTLIADIGEWLKAHPAKIENPGDFEPDGTLYSLIAHDGKLFTVEPNHGQVISVTTNGEIRQVIDVSASDGHIVPTAIVARDRKFYLGNLNLFPINPRSSRIMTISRDDDGNWDTAPGFETHGPQIVNSKAGFTTVVAVDFGPDGLLYVLELSDGTGYPTAGLGKVVRVKRSGIIEDVITGLVVPTGMTFGPDGRLYISNFGAIPAGTPLGLNAGQILRYDIAPGW